MASKKENEKMLFSNHEIKNKQILTTKILLDDYPFQPQKLEIKIDIPKSFLLDIEKGRY